MIALWNRNEKLYVRMKSFFCNFLLFFKIMMEFWFFFQKLTIFTKIYQILDPDKNKNWKNALHSHVEKIFCNWMQQTLCFYHKNSLYKLISRKILFQKNMILRNRPSKSCDSIHICSQNSPISSTKLLVTLLIMKILKKFKRFYVCFK